uniref:NB-ARC domain-containing protein n=1 Tax=Ciona intestinalis TaxID=7719 RepID=F6S6M4_CIOIN
MESTTSSIVVNTEVFNLSDSNISSIIVNQGSMEQPNVQPPTSICQLGQPISHFQTTEKFQELQALAVHNVTNNAIIHCSGFPGTGKSQIMRMLAQEFPFSEVEVEVSVKWHIECDDKRHKIKKSFKELVQRIYGNGLAHSGVPIDSIIGDLDNERAQSFVDLLQSSNVPVLIVAEDVTRRNLNEDD